MNFVTSVFKKYISKNEEKPCQEKGKAEIALAQSSKGASGTSSDNYSESLVSNQNIDFLNDEDESFQDAEASLAVNNIIPTEVPNSLFTLDLQDKKIQNSAVLSNALFAKTGELKNFKNSEFDQTLDSLNTSMVDSLELARTKDRQMATKMTDSIEILQYDSRNPLLQNISDGQEIDEYESLDPILYDSVEILNEANNKTHQHDTPGINDNLLTLEVKGDKSDKTLDTKNKTNESRQIIQTKSVSLSDILGSSSKADQSGLDNINSESQINANKTISETEEFISETSALKVLIQNVNKTLAIDDQINDTIFPSENALNPSLFNGNGKEANLVDSEQKHDTGLECIDDSDLQFPNSELVFSKAEDQGEIFKLENDNKNNKRSNKISILNTEPPTDKINQEKVNNNDAETLSNCEEKFGGKLTVIPEIKPVHEELNKDIEIEDKLKIINILSNPTTISRESKTKNNLIQTLDNGAAILSEDMTTQQKPLLNTLSEIKSENDPKTKTKEICAESIWKHVNKPEHDTKAETDEKCEQKSAIEISKSQLKQVEKEDSHEFEKLETPLKEHLENPCEFDIEGDINDLTIRSTVSQETSNSLQVEGEQERNQSNIQQQDSEYMAGIVNKSVDQFIENIKTLDEYKCNEKTTDSLNNKIIEKFEQNDNLETTENGQLFKKEFYEEKEGESNFFQKSNVNQINYENSEKLENRTNINPLKSSSSMNYKKVFERQDTREFEKLELQCVQSLELDDSHEIEQNHLKNQQIIPKLSRQDTFEILEKQYLQSINLGSSLQQLIKESTANENNPEIPIKELKQDEELPESIIFNRQETREFELMEKQSDENVEYLNSAIKEKNVEMGNSSSIQRSANFFDRQNTREFEKLEKECDSQSRIVDDILEALIAQNSSEEHNESLVVNTEMNINEKDNNINGNLETTEISQDEKNIDAAITNKNIMGENTSSFIRQESFKTNQVLKNENNSDVTTISRVMIEGNNILFNKENSQEFEDLVGKREATVENGEVIDSNLKLTKVINPEELTNNTEKAVKQKVNKEKQTKYNNKISTTGNMEIFENLENENIINIGNASEVQLIEKSSTSINSSEAIKKINCNSIETAKNLELEQLPANKNTLEICNESIQSNSALGNGENIDNMVINDTVYLKENIVLHVLQSDHANEEDKKIQDNLEETSALPTEKMVNTEIRSKAQEVLNKADVKFETKIDANNSLQAKENKLQNKVNICAIKTDANKLKLLASRDANQVQVLGVAKMKNIDSDHTLFYEGGSRNEELKSKVDLLQEQIDSVKKLNRRKNLCTSIPAAKEEEIEITSKYKNLLKEYEKHIARQTKDLNKLRMETEKNVRNFTNMEMAFSDVFEKYEKAKFIIGTYGKNEDILLENIRNAEEQLSQIEAKCFTMKQQSVEQITRAHEQVEQEKKTYKQEIAKLHAQVKRLEIKASSLEIALKQKTDECQALATLCDDITGRN